MPTLHELLKLAVERGASDLHLVPDRPPMLRIAQELVPAAPDPVTAADVAAAAEALLPPHLRDGFRTRREADFSHMEPGVGRFRVNVFVATGNCTISMRHVKDRVPSFEELHLPPQIRAIAMFPRGIVLATGTTGCGKSTTLAAIIEHINTHLVRRIVTIEDPIEYLFRPARSVISQREVGIDTQSFHAALKHVLRQDPDVIMIGEMRDAESFVAALSAAQTGHLVFSTLHTGTAAQAIPRILDFFPASERDSVRMALADNLRAVFCQRLVPSTDGGVRPAVEILIVTPTVRKLIEQNRLDKLPAAIETGTEDGMQTFNQSLYAMIRAGEVTEEVALRYASNPEALRMNLKGVFLDEARRILST
ncbi:MAG: PilT/PilU family type 4a pilus ATPase [Kiritimatiellae bacterium]|nr:PilT/PilU family type 4a pilus ATPase [Kiritimatiellia bacterium]